MNAKDTARSGPQLPDIGVCSSQVGLQLRRDVSYVERRSVKTTRDRASPDGPSNHKPPAFHATDARY